jgi:predicted nucleotidyltransferase
MLPLFRSPQQLRMLARVLLSREPVTAPQLREASGMSAASLHRELQRAEASGVVVRDASRRPHVFSPNRTSPLFEPLTVLLRTTVGVEAELARLLAGVPAIEAATIFGSWAAGDAGPSSDLDLLVVGDVNVKALRAKLRGLGKQIGIEIDATIVEPSEFESLARTRNPFLQTILNRPRIDLVGDLDRTLLPA